MQPGRRHAGRHGRPVNALTDPLLVRWYPEDACVHSPRGLASVDAHPAPARRSTRVPSIQ